MTDDQLRTELWRLYQSQPEGMTVDDARFAFVLSSDAVEWTDSRRDRAGEMIERLSERVGT